MYKLSLNGSWQLHAAETPETTYSAMVPGCVHDALYDAGAIEDINYRTQELDALWVGEKDGVYSLEFEVDEELLSQEHILLRCHGLDTLATICLNSDEIASTDNMFRLWDVDLSGLLKLGTNQLQITFASTLPLMAEKTAQRHLPAWNESHESWSEEEDKKVRDWGYIGRGYIRKMACNYGWDWGPMTISAGIWQDIEILAWSNARINDWFTTQEHHDDGSVTVIINVTPDQPVDLAIEASLSIDGETAGTAAAERFYGQKTLKIHIEHPELWWPNGLGRQALYDLAITLKDTHGRPLDTIKKRLGLRTLELITEEDAFGTSFVFAVNGIRFFAKGANWIPVDQYPSGKNLEPRYRHLLQSCKMANYNMIRVWGGGYFSHDAFYDLCDELGICVWQDMMFGCGTYPTWNRRFMDSVFEEVRDNARRLRHHASLALWCGNNELEMGFTADEWSDKDFAWDAYFELFDKLIPSALMQTDPNTPYIPGSPHGAPGERKSGNAATSGDCHFWNVWFSDAPFEDYRTQTHRFMSEFGHQSFPEPRTVNSFTEPKDRNWDSPVITHRQRSQPGNKRILEKVFDWFGKVEDFDAQCWLSQIAHGNGLRIGIEEWRRSWPRTTGATYWQLNDCWPAQTWSSIDYYGRWKATHYFAKRFFEPVLISALEDSVNKTVAIYINNDLPQSIRGAVTLRAYLPEGSLVFERTEIKEVSGVTSQPIFEVNFENLSQPVFEANLRKECDHPENLIVFLSFTALPNGRTYPAPSDGVVIFQRPHKLPLCEPNLTTSITAGPEDTFIIDITSDLPALWTWFSLTETDCLFSDNFFALRPNAPHQIIATPSTVMSLDEFKAQLEVKNVRQLMIPS